jgi:hypothetical protein
MRLAETLAAAEELSNLVSLQAFSPLAAHTAKPKDGKSLSQGGGVVLSGAVLRDGALSGFCEGELVVAEAPRQSAASLDALLFEEPLKDVITGLALKEELLNHNAERDMVQADVLEDLFVSFFHHQIS